MTSPDKLADAAKGEEKRGLAALVSDTGALLKTVDAFIDSLRVGERGDRSPLFNAARYLGHAARTEGMALLWYRMHEPEGTLRLADAVRRISRPAEVDLRGDGVGGDFFGFGK